MKKVSPFLFAGLVTLGSLPVCADDDLVRFVEHNVAQSVLEEHFGRMSENVSSDFTVKYDDGTVLKMIVSEYNKMLTENGGFVGADGVSDVCMNVLNEVLEPKNSDAKSDYIADTCYAFISDLVETEEQTSDSVSNCKYNVTMVQDKFHVKYEDKKTKHGFIRHCDSYIGWRNFNPGNIMDSPYKCARIGGKAVFENEEIGFKALAYLLTESSAYKDYTLRQKVPKYTVSDPVKYTAFLQKQGLDVDKKLSTFKDDPKELDKLLRVMAQKEGWFNGKKACKENEPYVKGSARGIEYF